MKKIISALFLMSFMLHFGQEKMITKNGTINFEASVPAFEEIKAKNEKVSCVLNTTTGEIASLALIKGFRFKIALMEEHFNENYIESDQYPKATFRGKIQEFNLQKVTEAGVTLKMSGNLEIRGKSEAVNTIAFIKKTKNGIEIKSNFDVLTDDFDIKIPSVISKKVSRLVKIETLFYLN